MATQKLKDYRPKTLAEYVDVIENLQAKTDGQLWYRGCSKLSHQLLPTLYRPRENPAALKSNLSDLEEKLVSRFRDQSLPYHSRELVDDLQTLFFMQHYGVPTRLLDWTGNPFNGLFFALRGAKYSSESEGVLRFKNDLVVWALDPSLWNQTSLEHISYRGGALDHSHDSIGPYKLVGNIDNLGAKPVAIYGAHNSQRIIAQQGTFVIFGSETTSMESLYKRGKFPTNSLSRVILSRAVIKKFRESLFSHGITEGALFPDLEGLGRDLRRTFGFQI